MKALHLGTNTIRLDDGRFLGLLHALPAGQKRYYNIVYVLQSSLPHRIEAVGKTALMLQYGQMNHGFIYTSSLLRVGTSVIIGYNVNDRTASLAVVPLESLLIDLETIEH